MRPLMLLALCVFLSGCGDLLSVHPLYTAEDRVLDPALEGRWENEDDTLTVVRDGNAYEITSAPKKSPAGETRKWVLHLVDLGGVRMADLIPADDAIGHMVVRVRVKDNELRVAFLDSEWLRQRVRHEDVRQANGQLQAVLMERTPQLRQLVRKYATVPQAYDEEISYHRLAQ